MPSTASSTKAAELPPSLPLLSTREPTSQLGCETFSCLASNYELLRTDRGYLLTKEPASGDGGAAACGNNLTCWLGHFDARPTTFGFELVLKSSESKGADGYFPGLRPEHVFQYGEPRESATTTADYQGDDPSSSSHKSADYDFAGLLGDHRNDDAREEAASGGIDYDDMFGFKR